MKASTFQKLKDIQVKNAAFAARPLVSWLGPEFGKDNAPRLMYIGKATNGWAEDTSLEHSRLRVHAKEFLIDFVATREYKSQFWYHAVDLMWHLSFGEIPDDRDAATSWAIPKIYWTNLIKIGDLNGNAIGDLRKVQLEASEAALREEMEEVRPDIIVLVSGGYCSQLVYSVFGENGWKTDESSFLSQSEFEYKPQSPHAAKGVYWTRHPQGWNRDKRIAAVELINNQYHRS